MIKFLKQSNYLLYSFIIFALCGGIFSSLLCMQDDPRIDFAETLLETYEERVTELLQENKDLQLNIERLKQINAQSTGKIIQSAQEYAAVRNQLSPLRRRADQVSPLRREIKEKDAEIAALKKQLNTIDKLCIKLQNLKP